MSRDGSRDSFSVINTIQDYIQKIISVGGMKALVLDEETVSISAAEQQQQQHLSQQALL
jgi:hypothetical protein